MGAVAGAGAAAAGVVAERVAGARPLVVVQGLALQQVGQAGRAGGAVAAVADRRIALNRVVERAVVEVDAGIEHTDHLAAAEQAAVEHRQLARRAALVQPAGAGIEEFHLLAQADRGDLGGRRDLRQHGLQAGADQAQHDARRAGAFDLEAVRDAVDGEPARQQGVGVGTGMQADRQRQGGRPLAALEQFGQAAAELPGRRHRSGPDRTGDASGRIGIGGHAHAQGMVRQVVDRLGADRAQRRPFGGADRAGELHHPPAVAVATGFARQARQGMIEQGGALRAGVETAGVEAGFAAFVGDGAGQRQQQDGGAGRPEPKAHADLP